MLLRIGLDLDPNINILMYMYIVPSVFRNGDIVVTKEYFDPPSILCSHDFADSNCRFADFLRCRCLEDV